jgi:hypothetical protein
MFCDENKKPGLNQVKIREGQNKPITTEALKVTFTLLQSPTSPPPGCPISIICDKVGRNLST